MEISEIEIQDRDIDWFAIDSVGAIAHFTSGVYGKLPKTVVKSREDLDFLQEFFIFTEQLPKFTTGQVDPEAFSMVRLVSDTLEARQNFLTDYLEMSSKGLYSYDSHDSVAHSGVYFRVNVPVKPVKIETLPEDVKQVLGKVLLSNVVFAEDNKILEANIINT